MDWSAIALIITNILWAGFAIYLIHLHNEEKKDLRNRLMARDYREYSYYADELPEFQKERREEIKQKNKEKKKEKPMTAEERELKGIVERF